MKFTPAHVDAFHRASQDANPLHRDAAYARRSQFGKPVVYGMAAVIYALAQWSAGRPFKLASLRADFKKPLFEGEHYDFQVSQARDGFRCRFGRGPIDYTLVSFVPCAEAPAPPSAAAPELPDIEFTPVGIAASAPRVEQREVCFSAGPCDALQAAFGIGVRSLPGSQLAALLWASYYVGMEMPGRQALFSELRMEYAAEAPAATHIRLRLAEAAFDERFNRYTLSGSGTGIERLSIAAFMRPDPVDFPLSSMRSFSGIVAPLQGRTVFVSGAARGFGAAFARLCALAGARLALNYRGDAAAANALRDELRDAGHEAAVFACDLEDAASVRRMGAEVASAFGGLDLIVNSAAPAIRELQFAEQSDEELLEFVRLNMAITLHTSRYLLPLLREDGQFIHISTKYLATPARGFSHYLAAKSAQEGFIRALAEEHRGVDFVIARLPRILTDQTNLPFSFEPPSDPRAVARKLLESAGERIDSNFRRLDLY
ncbi:MAG: SDR family oxidoreductase [Pseudomonadota bacterium]|nr:SDR family oxidoreductase [Pseudomonadota bacterium]